MIRKVLLPFDVGGDSERQIGYGRDIAALMGAELCLLHVTGEPAETIVSYAEWIDADLILMPTRGCGFLGQILFGSATMDVLRMANRPLWVAKPQSLAVERPVRCKRILCGVELGAKGEAVLRYAARLAKSCNGELLIVHAVPEISEAMLTQFGLDDSGEIELLPRAAYRRVSSMAATIGVPYQVETKTGDAATMLRKFAKRWRADVIVAGRGRRTNRWQMGNNIGEIILRSPCPVITHTGLAKSIQLAGPRKARPKMLAVAPRNAAFVGHLLQEMAI